MLIMLTLIGTAYRLSFMSAAWMRGLQRLCWPRTMTGDGMKMKSNHKSKRVNLGEHIVADPQICHGKPTFKGTRIMVFQVLEQVAFGTPWERIVWSWRGKVPMEAITEAVKLASEVFKDEGVFKPHAHHRRKYLGHRSLAAA